MHLVDALWYHVEAQTVEGEDLVTTGLFQMEN